MIDFRYHIVSIVAVFLALALGLFLGSTTLQSTVTNQLKTQADHVTNENKTLLAERDQFKAQLGQAGSFATAVEPYAVAGKLSSASVAVISAPGVDGGDRSALMTTLADAGATVTADVRISSAYLDPAQDAELGNLARELAGGRRLPRGTGAAEASYELAHALLARPTETALSPSRVAVVLNALTDGKMLSVTGPLPTHPASLAVLLVPGPSASLQSSVQVQQDTVLSDLTAALHGAASGVVVAAPTIDPTDVGGPLSTIRADASLAPTISTVDGDDTASGRVAVVLALAAAPGGTFGAYGSFANESALPSASPTP